MHYNKFERRLTLDQLQDLAIGTIVEVRLRKRLGTGRLDQIGFIVTAQVKSRRGASVFHVESDTLDAHEIKIPLVGFTETGLGYMGTGRVEVRLL
jgi:hypothetical protein